MKHYALIVLALLAGCSTVDHYITAKNDPAVVREREQTRRYSLCMKQQLGSFSSFASPESKRKASESCQGVMQVSATP